MTCAKPIEPQNTSDKDTPMTSVCFNDYSTLGNYINELPPPESAHVRVFRGQCKDYGNMRPTGVR